MATKKPISLLVLTATAVPSQTQTPPQLKATSTPIPKIISTPRSTVSSRSDRISKGDPDLSSSPTPVLRWNVDVIDVSWRDYYAISQPGWLSNSIARLAIDAHGLDERNLVVDISGGKNAKVVSQLVYSDWQIYSPGKTYVIECKNGMKMFRVKDSALISETPLAWPPPSTMACSTVVQWSPDESHVSYVDADQSVYIWSSNGTQPYRVLEKALSVYTAWSPNSSAMAVVKSETFNHIGTADIFDSNGKLLREFDLQVGDGADLSWLTDHVLTSHSRYTNWYYELQTGQLLFQWTSMPTGNGIWHQLPQISPDSRWVFIDQDSQIYKSALDPNHFLVHKEYSLYDVLDKKQIPLLNAAGNYLGYTGCNKDSSKVFLVNRPAGPSSINAPATPFGLLAYDVKTQKFDLILKDAVQVVWNSDKSWAFVVLAERDDQGKIGLAGGLWKYGTDMVIGKWHVAQEMIYRDPATDTNFPVFSGPIQVAWAHHRQSIAIADRYGRVKILEKNGKEHLLTDTLSSSESIVLRWSPDDHHLLVEQDNRAWIVNVPTP